MAADIEELHRIAMENGDVGYTDPASGFMAMTSETLRRRKRCCGNACRHCPYGHVNVRNPARRANLIHDTVLLPLSGRRLAGKAVDVVFFSGGKDSYLATLRLLKEVGGESGAAVVLLTSFAENNMVGHQQVPFKEVVAEQARSLRLDILAVPLRTALTYEEQIEAALLMLQREHGARVRRLVFGDLHVQSILEWRENFLRFGGDLKAVDFHFPVWHADYEDLMGELEASEAQVFVCAIGDSCPEEAKSLVRIGARYDRGFTEALRGLGGDCDLFGENGEFHSVVCLPGMDPPEILAQIVGAQEEELAGQTCAP